MQSRPKITTFLCTNGCNFYKKTAKKCQNLLPQARVSRFFEKRKELSGSFLLRSVAPALGFDFVKGVVETGEDGLRGFSGTLQREMKLGFSARKSWTDSFFAAGAEDFGFYKEERILKREKRKGRRRPGRKKMKISLDKRILNGYNKTTSFVITKVSHPPGGEFGELG